MKMEGMKCLVHNTLNHSIHSTEVILADSIYSFSYFLGCLLVLLDLPTRVRNPMRLLVNLSVSPQRKSPALATNIPVL